MSSQNKDKSGFERIYIEQRELIFRVARNNSDNNEHVAQEITQEVFLKLYKHFDTFDEDYLVKWLTVTAKNVAKNYKKKMKRETLDGDIGLTAELRTDHTIESAEDSVLDEMNRREKILFGDSILEALYEKNERWYDAITMVYCMGKKQSDVAEELGISLEVLHSVLYRAKQWIKKNYRWDEYTQ